MSPNVGIEKKRQLHGKSDQILKPDKPGSKITLPEHAHIGCLIHGHEIKIGFGFDGQNLIQNLADFRFCEIVIN